MSGGGDSGGSDKATTTNEPWSAQQPYLKDVFNEGAAQFDQSQNAQLPSTFVDPNANILAGWQGTLDYANTGGRNVSDQTLQGFGNLMGSIDVANSPLVQAQIEQANRQVSQDFARNVMPEIGIDALTAGQYGSSRQGVAEGLAAAGAAQTMADQATDIMANSYQIGSQNAQAAMQGSPTVWQMGNMPSMAQGQVGQDQAAWEQAALDDQLAQWYWGQQRPWDLLSMYQGLVTGGFGGQSDAQS